MTISRDSGGSSISIGRECTFEKYAVVFGHGGVTIGDYALIGAHVVITSVDHVRDDVTVPSTHQALLRRPATSHTYTVRVGDLELDRLTQKVRRAGRRIDLTAKEYALLEYFAANAGRVLTRTMIMEHVWDESFEGLTNIVDVYVRHLRTKIDDAHEQKLIRTVRGAGYCLTDEAGP